MTYNRTSFDPSIFGFGAFPGPARTREQQLEAERDEARRRLQELVEGVPTAYGTVLDVGEKEMIVAQGPNFLEMRRPKDVAGLVPGALVRIFTKSMQVLNVASGRVLTGMVGTVRDVVDDSTCVVMIQNAERTVVFAGPRPRTGDRVVLDFLTTAVLRNLGQASAELALEADTGVTWDDILGQEEAKRQLLEAIEEPILHRETYARYGKARTKGVLLHGPAGNGKTMFGKAAATAMAKLHGKSPRAGGYLYVKGPELLNKYVGGSEGNVRSLFESARAYHRAHGRPAIIFIDEAEALLSKRGTFRGEGADMQRTMVPMFLAEMDGLEDSGAFVLLATNRPQDLDPAVVRDGRVDRKVYVARPTREDAEAILAHYLRDKPLAGKARALAKEAVGNLFSEAHALYMARCTDGSDQRFTLARLVSGAMVAGLAEKATQTAIRREIAAKRPQAITAKDLAGAVASVFEENRALDHAGELAEFVEPIREKLKRVERVKRPALPPAPPASKPCFDPDDVDPFENDDDQERP